MLALGVYRDTRPRLSDYLPWAALVAPGVVLDKDGALQRTAAFRGPDLDSATPAELTAVTARLGAALRRLGSGWAMFVEAQRAPAVAYPQSRFDDPASALVDLERAEQFSQTGAHFESRYFLTLAWLPPAEEARRAEGWLFEGRKAVAADPWTQTKAFIVETDRLLQLLDGFMPQCAWLDDGQTLSYLHSTVSTVRQTLAVPHTPIHLDALLATQPLVGGLEPRLGRAHLRTLTLVGFPSATFPGVLDELNRLAFDYRWTTRAVMLDKLAAAKVLGRIRRQWFAKRKSVAAILKEVMTNEASVLVDNDAANKAADADAALQDLGADIVGHAYVTATLTVWDEDPARASEKLRQVEKVVRGRDFSTIVETLNAVEAWLGSLPGHVYANVRQPPISTQNLAHIVPLSAVWAGPERNDHLDGPPLFYARTEGATPFRLSLHVDDVAHTLVAGPTGAGKSVFLAFTALSWRRYPNNQIFAFDHGASLRAAGLAMGGEWHDLGAEVPGRTVSLQPLRRIDEPGERTWALEWLAAVLTREGVTIDPAAKAHLWSALESLASAPPVERTLSGLAALLQAPALKQALAPFCLGGAHGRLLDADAESLGTASVQVFETAGLLKTNAAPAVLAYLFHRIEHALDGRPTLILIDEGWLILEDPVFAGQLREWIKTLRKKNGAVVFATEALLDLDASPVAATILDSCPTRIFLPNARAAEPRSQAIYRKFGLNDRQIEIISRAAPRRDYYCQSRHGHRLFDLGLGEIALAFCAAASKPDQALIDAIDAAPGAAFTRAWLLARGLPWAADLVSHLPLEP